MDGAHDLGGQAGFGPVDRSQTDHFPNQWEAQVFSITLACGMLGKWNLDQARFAREGMDPEHYLGSSYYEHWLHGLETLLLAQHLVTEEELSTGVANMANVYSPWTDDKYGNACPRVAQHICRQSSQLVIRLVKG